MKRLLLIVLFALAASGQTQAPDAEQVAGPPAGRPLAGQALDTRAHEVSVLLRCPVCQGLSIADSPSEMATNMRGQVRELLSRGFTEEQILAYFEHSYGQFVLLKPRFLGVTSFVWILPLLVLVLGSGIVIRKLTVLEKPLTTEAYRDRVRDLTRD